MNFLFRFVCLALWATVLAAPAIAQETKTSSAADSIAVLQSPEASTFDKAKACQRLATVGGDDAVPALAALLGDEQLNAYARSALEAFASPAADQALRDAAQKLSGRQLEGVILSFGNRRDEQAVPLLEPLLASNDSSVVAAAAAALGEIATPAAARALMNQPPGPVWLAEASLECADRLAATDSATANELYRHLIQGQAPKHVQQAAMLGQFRLLKNGQVEWLDDQLHKKDRDYFNLGLAATREAPGKDVTVALVKRLPAMEPGRRALLLRALGDRSDPLPVETLLAEVKSDAPAVQEAAIEVLAKSQSPEAAAELVNVALGGGRAAKTAADRLESLESDSVDAVIARRLELPGNAQPVVVALVGKRRMAELKPKLRELLASSDENTRRAAISALGLVGELDDLDLLLDRALGDAADAETNVAQKALRTAAMRMSDREACAELLTARLSSSPSEHQAFLLTRLREVGGNNALAAVTAHAKSDESELKDTATRELGNWPSPEAAETLLDLAKNDPEQKYRIRALRGYLRIARQFQLPDDERMRFFHAAMQTAERNEEKRLALDVLTRISSPQALELATAHLSEPALRDPAAETALAISAKLATSDPAAVKKAIEKVLAAGVSDNLAERAREINQKLEAPGT